MGAVDLVIQVESPRLGGARACSASAGPATRSASRAGASCSPSTAPTWSRRPWSCDRMQRGLIEHTRYPRNPLDVLAQQIVAMCALDEWTVDELAALVRRAANFADLSDEVLTSVLDLLSGRYPSDEFAELRPRIVWDRVERHRARPGRRPAPGRHQRRHHPRPRAVRRVPARRHPRRRARRGDGLREPPGRDVPARRVHVAHRGHHPRAGRSSRRRRASPGRCRSGTATARAGRSSSAGPSASSCARSAPGRRAGGDRPAARRPRPRRARPPQPPAVPRRAGRGHRRGARRPHDRGRALPRRDRRLAGLRPLAVRRPGARAVGDGAAGPPGASAGASTSSCCGATTASSLRLPEAVDELPLDELLIDPDEIDELVDRAAARHRAVRVALPRVRGPRAAAAAPPARPAHAAVAAAPEGGRPADGRGAAPDVPDPARDHARVRQRRVRPAGAARGARRPASRARSGSSPVDTPRASPFAQSLLFGWIAVYMYEGDAPLAERRAAALALDRDLLRDLLGAEELRELLDPAVLADLELELQRLVDGRRARDADELHDLLRVLGPLIADRPRRPRSTGDRVADWVEQLVARAPGHRGQHRRRGPHRRGRGRRPPARRARRRRCRSACRPRSPTRSTIRWSTSSPATPAPTARSSPRTWPRRLGVAVDRVQPSLEALEADGRVVRGEFRPDGVEREWCDDDVLRQLRRRSLAALRREVEPVDADALARFLPAWQGVGLDPARARRRWSRCSASLPGRGHPGVGARGRRAPGPPRRVPAGRPRRAVHVGRGGVGRRRRARRHRRPGAAAVPRPGRRCSCPPPMPSSTAAARCTTRCATHLGAARRVVLARARRARPPPPGCATTTPRCSPRCGTSCGPGEVTNDSLAPLRALGRAARRRARRRSRPAAPPARVAWPGSARRPAPAAGRSSRRCCEPAPTPTEARPRPGAAAARALRRAHPRGGAGRGRSRAASPACTRCSRRSRSGAGAARLLRRRPRRRAVRAARRRRPPAVVRSDAVERRGRDATPALGGARRHRPGPALRRALPWPDSAGRPAARRGRARRAGRRRAARLPRAGRPQRRHVPGRGRRPGWAGALRAIVERGRYRSIEIRKVDGEPVRDDAAAADVCAPPASSRATRASSTAPAAPAPRTRGGRRLP